MRFPNFTQLEQVPLLYVVGEATGECVSARISFITFTVPADFAQIGIGEFMSQNYQRNEISKNGIKLVKQRFF